MGTYYFQPSPIQYIVIPAVQKKKRKSKKKNRTNTHTGIKQKKGWTAAGIRLTMNMRKNVKRRICVSKKDTLGLLFR